MPRQIFTAADIFQLARQQKAAVLVLGTEDVVTLEAEDLAATLGVQLVRGKIDAPVMPRAVASEKGPELPGLKVVRGARLRLEPFGEGLATSGTNVRLQDVITERDGSSMAAGYMSLERGEFPWTLNYDEIDIVLEGELVIRRGNEVVRGGPGDVIFIPKGSSIVFSTPSNVRFTYVAFPANWKPN